jgi:hypothetical protein
MAFHGALQEELKTMNKQVLTEPEFAAAVGLAHITIRLRRRNNQLKGISPIRIGRRVFYTHDDVKRFLEASRAPLLCSNCAHDLAQTFVDAGANATTT